MSLGCYRSDRDRGGMLCEPLRRNDAHGQFERRRGDCQTGWHRQLLDCGESDQRPADAVGRIGI